MSAYDDGSASPDPGVAVGPLGLDLFCGAGGLSLGLTAAGVRFAGHLDCWRPAVDTLNANFGESSEPTDIAELSAADIVGLAGQTPDILVGGPPCQSFTSAGRRREDDPRGTLVGVFGTLAAEVRPAIVIFENVEGFLTAGGGRFVFELLDPLLEAGYRVVVRKVNLANYGVPQHRKRVIVIGSLVGTPWLPHPTHGAWGAPGAQAVPGAPPTPTVAQALEGLAPPGTEAAPQGHVLPEVGDLEQARISALCPGQTMRDLPAELQHASYGRRAFRRVMDGTPSENRGGAPAGLRRLRPDEPSKAITSAAIREFVHATADRRLTLREAARLQTFPDWFEFFGSAADQATLVGNAVPPRFGAALGSAVVARLATGTNVARESGAGALVEFVPTTAAGMSPVLAGVVADVRDRYARETLFARPLA